MKTTVPLLQSQNPPEFMFRGNAVAAGGFVTELAGKPIAFDPRIVTTHGESSLPLIGGVSHSLIEKPQLNFPQYISYDNCETFAEGRLEGEQAVTTARASVSNVRITTSPTPKDNIPDVHSMTFQANSFSTEIQSIYPQTGQPAFKINAASPRDMTFVVRDKFDKDTALPIALDFDLKFLSFSTMQQMDEEFLGNRQFFDEYAPRFQSLKKLIFGRSKVPRTVQGYIITSFVRQIQIGNELIPGNVLTRKGFGTIQFGVVVGNALTLRICMALIKTVCDPTGGSNFAGTETNGIWK